MAPARVLDRGRAALVVIDVEEAFRPAVGDFDAVTASAAALLLGAAGTDEFTRVQGLVK